MTKFTTLSFFSFTGTKCFGLSAVFQKMSSTQFAKQMNLTCKLGLPCTDISRQLTALRFPLKMNRLVDGSLTTI